MGKDIGEKAANTSAAAARSRLAQRTGMRKAKVALARKLAVVMHRMLVDNTPFAAERAAVAT